MAGALLHNGNPAGNYYDKYNSSNPIARWLMNGFVTSVCALAKQTGEHIAHEVGCGEGHLSAILHAQGFNIRGSDVSPEIIDVARTQTAQAGLAIEFKTAGVEDLRAPEDAAALVVCCEVLEHLEDPQSALRRLTELASPYLILSVPREPLWRFLNVCRGRYLTSAGNTPGHIQHWSKAEFVKLIERYVEVIDIATPLPWTVVLCKTRR
jgi:2-polyprenyl-3-methyl-5-hydroxy-6-metoxy-1,4-benzoquinol methylase